MSTVEQSVVYRDTTIYVQVPEVDTVTVYGTIRDTIYASAGTAHARTYIKRDTVYLDVWRTDTTLVVELDSVIRELELKKTEVHVAREAYKRTKFDRYLNKGITIALIVLAVFLVRLFKK